MSDICTACSWWARMSWRKPTSTALPRWSALVSRISQPTMPPISATADHEGDDVHGVLPPREHDDVVVAVIGVTVVATVGERRLVGLVVGRSERHGVVVDDGVLGAAQRPLVDVIRHATSLASTRARSGRRRRPRAVPGAPPGPARRVSASPSLRADGRHHLPGPATRASA